MQLTILANGCKGLRIYRLMIIPYHEPCHDLYHEMRSSRFSVLCLLVIMLLIMNARLTHASPEREWLEDTPAGIKLDFAGTPHILEGVTKDQLKGVPIHTLSMVLSGLASRQALHFAGALASANPGLASPLYLLSLFLKSGMSLQSVRYLLSLGSVVSGEIKHRTGSIYRYWSCGQRQGYMPVYLEDNWLADHFYLKVIFPDNRFPQLSIQRISHHQPDEKSDQHSGWEVLYSIMHSQQIDAIDVRIMPFVQSISGELLIKIKGRNLRFARLVPQTKGIPDPAWHLTQLGSWCPDYSRKTLFSVFEDETLMAIAQALVVGEANAGSYSFTPREVSVRQSNNQASIVQSVFQSNAQSKNQSPKKKSQLTLVHSNYGEPINQQQGTLYLIPDAVQDLRSLLRIAASQQAEIVIAAMAKQVVWKQHQVSVLLAFLQTIIGQKLIDQGEISLRQMTRNPKGFQAFATDRNADFKASSTDKAVVSDHNFNKMGAVPIIDYPNSQPGNAPSVTKQRVHSRQVSKSGSSTPSGKKIDQYYKNHHRPNGNDPDPFQRSSENHSDYINYSPLETMLDQMLKRFGIELAHEAIANPDILSAIQNRLNYQQNPVIERQLAIDLAELKITEQEGEIAGLFNPKINNYLSLLVEYLQKSIWIFSPSESGDHQYEYIDTIKRIYSVGSIGSIQQKPMDGDLLFTYYKGQFIQLEKAWLANEQLRKAKNQVSEEQRHLAREIETQYIKMTPHLMTLEHIGFIARKNGKIYLTKHMLSIVIGFWKNNQLLFSNIESQTENLKKAEVAIKDYSLDLVDSSQFSDIFIYFPMSKLSGQIADNFTHVVTAVSETLDDIAPPSGYQRIAVYGGVAKAAYLAHQCFPGGFSELKRRGYASYNDIDLMFADEWLRDQFQETFLATLKEKNDWFEAHIETYEKGRMNTRKVVIKVGGDRFFALDLSIGFPGIFDFDRIERKVAFDIPHMPAIKLPLIRYEAMLDKLLQEMQMGKHEVAGGSLNGKHQDTERRVKKAAEQIFLFQEKDKNLQFLLKKKLGADWKRKLQTLAQLDVTHPHLLAKEKNSLDQKPTADVVKPSVLSDIAKAIESKAIAGSKWTSETSQNKKALPKYKKTVPAGKELVGDKTFISVQVKSSETVPEKIDAKVAIDEKVPETPEKNTAKRKNTSDHERLQTTDTAKTVKAGKKINNPPRNTPKTEGITPELYSHFASDVTRCRATQKTDQPQNKQKYRRLITKSAARFKHKKGVRLSRKQQLKTSPKESSWSISHPKFLSFLVALGAAGGGLYTYMAFQLLKSLTPTSEFFASFFARQPDNAADYSECATFEDDIIHALCTRNQFAHQQQLLKVFNQVRTTMLFVTYRSVKPVTSHEQISLRLSIPDNVQTVFVPDSIVAYEHLPDEMKRRWLNNLMAHSKNINTSEQHITYLSMILLILARRCGVMNSTAQTRCFRKTLDDLTSPNGFKTILNQLSSFPDHEETFSGGGLKQKQMRFYLWFETTSGELLSKDTQLFSAVDYLQSDFNFKKDQYAGYIGEYGRDLQQFSSFVEMFSMVADVDKVAGLQDYSFSLENEPVYKLVRRIYKGEVYYLRKRLKDADAFLQSCQFEGYKKEIAYAYRLLELSSVMPIETYARRVSRFCGIGARFEQHPLRWACFFRVGTDRIKRPWIPFLAGIPEDSLQKRIVWRAWGRYGLGGAKAVDEHEWQQLSASQKQILKPERAP